MDFHLKLKEKRLEKGLKQKDLASYLFVSNKTYSQYERGLRNVEISTFLKLIDFLDIKIEDINCQVSIHHLYKNLVQWYEKIGKKLFEKQVSFLFLNEELPCTKKQCQNIFSIVKNYLEYIIYFSENKGQIIIETKQLSNALQTIIKNNNNAMTFDKWIEQKLIDGEITLREIEGFPNKELLLNELIRKGIQWTKENFVPNYMEDFFEHGGEVKSMIDEQGRVYFSIQHPIN